MKFWKSRRKSSFDAQELSSNVERFSCGLIRRNSWASLSSLRPKELQNAIKKYKKEKSSNRRYIFGKLKNDDQIFTDVILGRALGSGASGTVYLADLHGLSVAVKIVNLTIDRPVEIPESFISNIHHSNLLHIMAVRQNVDTSNVSGREQSLLSLSWDSVSSGSFTELAKGIPSKEGGDLYETQEAWIMTEYCDQGSLFQAIIDKRFHRNSDLQRPHMTNILRTANQIADAIACLHRMGIVHGDLKSQNVFLKTVSGSRMGFVAKVGDFGMSRKLRKNGVLRTNLWGTVDHMPPELLRDGDLRMATDVFSFGMILLEFFTARRPFERKTSTSILISIVQGVRPEIPHYVPTAYAELIRDCWNQDWKKRPQFKDIHRRLGSMLSDADLYEDNIADAIKFGPCGSSSA